MTIFEKIARREIPAEIVYEEADFFAFKDINPQAPVHVLLATKEHIPSLDAVTADHAQLIGAAIAAVPKIAESLGVAGNYRLISNCGEGAGQSVSHLHFHIVSGSDELRTRLL